MVDINNDGVVAFFTPEIAIDQRLPFYSGGLGVVAGDAARTAKRIGLSMVFVTILPREGYYDQYIDGDKMGIRYVRWERENEFLDDTGILFPIEINYKLNWVKVWKLKDMFNTVPVYLLDSDIEQNDYLARFNTRQLYGGSMYSGLNLDELNKRKIAQYLILGKGGVEALKRLKVPVKKYHLNEGHNAFAAVELLTGALDKNMSFEEAVKYCKSMIVFTTHTPVAAGNPSYDIDLVAQMASLNNQNSIITLEYLKKLGADPYGQFNLAMCCMRLAGKANAVSQKHLAVAQDIWRGIEGCAPLIGITNGVDQKGFWQYDDFRDADIPEKIAKAKLEHKRDVLRRYAPHFDENIFLGCWGRRWASYKRPQLLFYDREWISNLLKTRQLQLIVAGKPHPDDKDRIDDWNWLLGLTRSEDFPNLVLLPGYELDMMKDLQAGADIWINTPRSPNEASGTSGMKANGAISLSTPDGWMCEAEPSNCFLFGLYAPMSIPTHDKADAEALKEAENNARTMFYFNRKDWSRKMINSNRERMERWSMDRALTEYAEKLYQ